MAYAHRTVFAPARLEFECRLLVGMLDAEAVVQVDQLPVARRALAVARVVAAHHADAGIIKVVAIRAVGRRSPRTIAETHALALRAARAGDLERARLGR